MRLATIDRHHDLTRQLVRAVSERDGWQCTCTGACGRRHPALPDAGTPRGPIRPGEPDGGTAGTPVGRCPVGAGPALVQLWVVRTDQTFDAVEWWRLPAAAAATFCESCAPDVTGRTNPQTSDTSQPDAHADGAR